MEERIINNRKIIELTNELISDCGEPQKIASRIKELIIDYLAELRFLGRFLENINKEAYSKLLELMPEIQNLNSI